MNIIITRKSVQYSQQFLKFESLKQAAGTIGHIEFLIYNDSTDTEQDKTLYIDKIKPRVSKFIYIRDPRKGDDAVKLLMPALGGIIFDDEYFLEDEEELINMLSYSISVNISVLFTEYECYILFSVAACYVLSAAYSFQLPITIEVGIVNSTLNRCRP